MSKAILVTGALGQIGSELVPALRARYGQESVIASDVRMPPIASSVGDAPFEHLDCTRPQQIQDILSRHNVGIVYHLAALLSAVAEDKPCAYQKPRLSMNSVSYPNGRLSSGSCWIS